MNDSSPGWFGRNWKWFVPVGCLTLLLVAATAAALLAFGVHRAYTSSSLAEPGNDALAAARAHPAVIRALGQPLERGFMMSGRIDVTNDEGNADIRYRLQGPRGKGWLHVVGQRRQGRWQYDVLQAQIDGQATPIDLRPMQPAPASTPEPAAPPAD